MTRIILLLGVVFIVFLAVTWLLHRFFKGNKYIKYIPALLALALGIYNFYLSKTMDYTGFEDIAKMLFAVMLFTGFVSGALTGVFVDYVFPAIKKR